MIRNTDADRLIEILRSHRAELEAAGVRHLALFGSVARGDANDASDIDLAAVWDRMRVRTLFDMGAAAVLLEEMLGTDNFDIADEERLRPPVRAAFDREHVRVF